MRVVKANTNDEYTRLYNELTSMNSIYATENIAMYTLTVMIIGFGWQYESIFLFLLCFAILIPFQILLGGHLNTFLRNGAYLMVFHEAENNALSWEEAHDYFQAHVSRDLGQFRFQRMGSSILGMIAIVCAIVTFIRHFPLNGLPLKEAVVLLLLTAIAEVFTIIVNLYYVSGSQLRKRSNIYKQLFIEASILHKVRAEQKNHPEVSIGQIFDQVFKSACAKYKQYSPLTSLDALASKEIQNKLRKILIAEEATYECEVSSQYK